MSSHVHAFEIGQYANDAVHYERPWMLWEIDYRTKPSGWRKCKVKDMCFLRNRKYRRIPNPTASRLRKASSNKY